MTLRIRLRKARKLRGFTQKQLGEAVGMTQQAIYKLEAGHVKTTQKIEQLAEILNVYCYWLKYGPNNEPLIKE